MNATDAAAATADADTALVFDPVVLGQVYAHASPYIAGVSFSPGLIVRSTPEHDLVAVHTQLITEIPRAVTYYHNNTEAPVDAVAVVSDHVTILFARRDGEPLPNIEFADHDLSDGVSEKVLSFFPHMGTVAMFKGHIGLKDATSREMGEEGDIQTLSLDTFSFTAPYASVANIARVEDRNSKLLKTESMTLGAPVFNLDGRVVGILSSISYVYRVKFAKDSAYLQDIMQRLWGEDVIWLKGEDIVRPNV